jgi:hypothetical protein
VNDDTTLEDDESELMEWWTKYPGFDDFCAECPAYFAIAYDDHTESCKDQWAGSFGWITFTMHYIFHDSVAILLGQWQTHGSLVLQQIFDVILVTSELYTTLAPFSILDKFNITARNMLESIERFPIFVQRSSYCRVISFYSTIR